MVHGMFYAAKSHFISESQKEIGSQIILKENEQTNKQTNKKNPNIK